MHFVQEHGGKHHRYQDATGQVERHEVGADALFAEHVREYHHHRFERTADLGHHPADNQQCTDQHVRQPGADCADLVVVGQLVELHLDRAKPFGGPLLRIGKIPFRLRHQEADTRRGGHDRQAHQPTQQGRELRAEEDARRRVGQGERKSAEDREGQHFKARFPALFLAEEARQHQHHDQGHHGPDNRVDDRHIAGDELQVLRPARTLFDQLCADGGRVESAIDADDDRRTDRAERHRRALHQHAEHHRGHRREAEARRAFDEAAEQPGDDDGLDPAVRADGGKAGADGADPARILERVQQQDRAENDPQHTDGDYQALQRGGQDAVEAHVPGDQPDGCGHQIDDRHRMFGRPAQADEQDCRKKNRGERQKGEGASLHRGCSGQDRARGAERLGIGCGKTNMFDLLDLIGCFGLV